ncbi:hypothetical protein IQ241_18245 [Romeria aff. gracilis LEGE 07310]|uniref:Cyanobacterial TRADD-N associated 2 transmembrane domain-containing protein n=1 Tax=Vasconcelosia minhoensis LEGE 07310 TaxID=915328 RepID=A0A8J7ARJ9_9CYAN|nr:hypothetical protein [Romeria gracilis]MBE9079216.1 hypothetical protein [Romeria aff. gracilis LEGE 07310]
MKNQPSDPYQDIELDAYKEMLRQAKQTFNMHCLGVVVCAILTAGGVYAFLKSGRVVEVAITGAAGTGTLCFGKLARDSIKESERRLTKIIKQVKTAR